MQVNAFTTRLPGRTNIGGLMGSNLQMVFRSFGVVFLGLGLTAGIIQMLSLRYGTGHKEAVALAIGSLLIGAVLFGAGTMLRRRAN